MTKEEAARILAVWKEKFRFTDGGEQVIDLAIEALKVEPCEDAISRQAAIDALKQQAEAMSEWSNCYAEQRKGVLTAVNIVEDLPSAKPERIPCEDAVSRKDVIGGFCDRCDTGLCNSSKCRKIEWIRDLPSVNSVMEYSVVSEDELAITEKPTDCSLQDLNTKMMQKCSQCQFRLKARHRRR